MSGQAGTSRSTSKAPSNTRRLKKELMTMMNHPPVGIKMDKKFMDTQANQLAVWRVKVRGAPDTIFAGEIFKLCVKFNDRYPFEAPEVTFIGPHIPVHPHVYSNGHICLSILTEDWSAALTVEAVCISILSMLSSATEKIQPPNDAFYVATNPDGPRKTRWVYDDDKV